MATSNDRASPGQATRRSGRLRRAIPAIGTVALVAYMLHSTDLDAVAAAFAAASWGHVVAVMGVGTLTTWIADSACLYWLLGRIFGAPAAAADPSAVAQPDRARLGLSTLARIKAASYVLNIINYHAATLGMAWVIARRRGVGFVAAAAALAVLSWLDLVALAALVSVGLASAPDLLGADANLQRVVGAATVAIPLGALALVVVARWRERLPLVAALAAPPPTGAGVARRLASTFATLVLTALEPLGSLRLGDLVLGVGLRACFMLLYVIINHQLMIAFGMTPSLLELVVLIPVMTVVGVVPLSVSGIGTTQIVARSLYAGYVPAGAAVAPVIDAYTTALIVGFIVARLLLALPQLGGVLAELRDVPPADEAAAPSA